MHKRVIDGEEQGAPGPHGIPLSNLSRLLICQTQAGCLIGKCAPGTCLRRCQSLRSLPPGVSSRGRDRP